MLRGHLYDDDDLSVHLHTEDKCDDSKVQFLWGIRVSIWSLSSAPHENSVRFLMQNWERRYFKTIGDESLCENSNGSGVRLLLFTSENL